MGHVPPKGGGLVGSSAVRPAVPGGADGLLKLQFSLLQLQLL